jgi:hypothetical protein
MEIASQEHGLNALIRLFDDSELYYSWGNWAGRTSIARMNWILLSTRGSGAGGGPEYDPGLPKNLKYAAYNNEVLNDALVCGFLPFQFGIDLSGETGFAADFQDQGFYNGPWNSSGHVTTQVQHFLSAVALSAPFNAVNIRYFDLEHGIKTIIGHEKLSDRTSSEEDQINATTDTDLDRWYRAANADANGDIATRDAQLWAILKFGSDIDFGAVDPRREGNSLQDMRLSLKGYRFFLWVKENGSTQPSSAASWLRLNLQGK